MTLERLEALQKLGGKTVESHAKVLVAEKWCKIISLHAKTKCNSYLRAIEYFRIEEISKLKLHAMQAVQGLFSVRLLHSYNILRSL